MHRWQRSVGGGLFGRSISIKCPWKLGQLDGQTNGPTDEQNRGDREVTLPKTQKGHKYFLQTKMGTEREGIKHTFGN